MTFKIDYEHIFFDRYSLCEEEKVKEAISILNRVFKTAKTDKENFTIEICAEGAEREAALKNSIRMLKREFFLLLKEVEKPVEIPKPTDEIDLAEKYIRKNYLNDDFCANRVCDYCNIGRKRLDDAFLKRFSKSVSEYIKALRVKKAEELIADDLKMEEVAYLCGFGSVKTMQRAFKSVHGKTPSEYRTARLTVK